MLAAMAAPAMAAQPVGQSRGVVVLNPGASGMATGGWTQQQPTAFLNTDEAMVLNDGLAYISAGGFVGSALPGSTINYTRGLGNGQEFGIDLGLTYMSAANAFTANVGGEYKLQLARSASNAIAVDAGLDIGNIGQGAVGLRFLLGLPITFGAGLGDLTVQPRVLFPTLTAGTAGGSAQVAVGYITPIATNWQLLLDAVPQYGFGGGFTLPVGVGFRFSPTATSHVDLGIGQLQSSPFQVGVGLLNVIGHVGF